MMVRCLFIFSSSFLSLSLDFLIILTTQTHIHRSKVHSMGSTSLSFKLLSEIIHNLYNLETQVPTSAIGPLTYWILIQSVLCYFLMTWGNKWSGEGSNAVVYVLVFCISFTFVRTHIHYFNTTGTRRCNLLQVVL